MIFKARLLKRSFDYNDILHPVGETSDHKKNLSDNKERFDNIVDVNRIVTDAEADIESNE
jgi:hypothetical protein